jgi:hypothetical protein
MAAKVDSTAVQDGFQIYHHAFFFTHGGKWCVVQQGMKEATGFARRYHWLGKGVEDFVCEPHTAICSDQRQGTLNMVARESKEARTASAEAARLHPDVLGREMIKMDSLFLPARHKVLQEDVDPRHLRRILLTTYEEQPEDFERLLGIRGVGPKTVRALSLVAELIYGKKASTRDPARFSFAHGGKDGTPFPVDREIYSRTLSLLEQGILRAKVEPSEKDRARRRLGRFLDPSEEK